MDMGRDSHRYQNGVTERGKVLALKVEKRKTLKNKTESVAARAEPGCSHEEMKTQTG